MKAVIGALVHTRDCAADRNVPVPFPGEMIRASQDFGAVQHKSESYSQRYPQRVLL